MPLYLQPSNYYWTSGDVAIEQRYGAMRSERPRELTHREEAPQAVLVSRFDLAGLPEGTLAVLQSLDISPAEGALPMQQQVLVTNTNTIQEVSDNPGFEEPVVGTPGTTPVQEPLPEPPYEPPEEPEVQYEEPPHDNAGEEEGAFTWNDENPPPGPSVEESDPNAGGGGGGGGYYYTDDNGDLHYVNSGGSDILL